MKVCLLIYLAVVGSSGLESISKGQGSRIDPQVKPENKNQILKNKLNLKKKLKIHPTMKHKRWVRYELVEFFGGPKVLNSENFVYKRNFGRKKCYLNSNELQVPSGYILKVVKKQG